MLSVMWGWVRSERPGLVTLDSTGDVDVMLDRKPGSVLDGGVGSTVDEDKGPGTIGMVSVDGDKGMTRTAWPQLLNSPCCLRLMILVHSVSCSSNGMWPITEQ